MKYDNHFNVGDEVIVKSWRVLGGLGTNKELVGKTGIIYDGSLFKNLKNLQEITIKHNAYPVYAKEGRKEYWAWVHYDDLDDKEVIKEFNKLKKEIEKD